MKALKFDFNNMFACIVGRRSGVTETELKKIGGSIRRAHRHLETVAKDRESRSRIGLEWMKLPFMGKPTIDSIQRLGDEIASSYENVVSLGIGGSYLGLKAAQDALCPPYYNEFRNSRNGRPRVYFDGNNLDPQTLGALLGNLDPKKTFVVVISKSGETTETKAAFSVAEEWLRRGAGRRYGRQVFAITDPELGTLRNKTRQEQAKDALSFRSLPVIKGVGGRFSELNIGLLHLAIIGVRIQEVLDGASSMAGRCSSSDLLRNPAAMYAALHTVLYKNKGKTIAVLMPFSETLKSTADWYVQLLAESLGKKHGRRIKRGSSGMESWSADVRKVVNVGRTPISSRGTNDLHSIQQNNIEGEDNKVVTFIKVERFKKDIKIRGTGDFLERRRYSRLLSLAEEATEWALVAEGRANCAIIMPEITPFHWGELIFFFEMATAYEGELLDVNAFDQPGVEGYKNYMYYKLGRRRDLSEELIEAIAKRPLEKRRRFII